MPTAVIAKVNKIGNKENQGNKFISIEADVFFVDGIAFLLTVTIKIKFVTVEHTPFR